MKCKDRLGLSCRAFFRVCNCVDIFIYLAKKMGCALSMHSCKTNPNTQHVTKLNVQGHYKPWVDSDKTHLFSVFFFAFSYKALKNGQKKLPALNFSKSVMEERSLMIRVLIALFSGNILKYSFPTFWEALNIVWASAEVRSTDPDIAGQKNALIWVSRQIWHRGVWPKTWFSGSGLSCYCLGSWCDQKCHVTTQPNSTHENWLCKKICKSQ